MNKKCDMTVNPPSNRQMHVVSVVSGRFKKKERNEMKRSILILILTVLSSCIFYDNRKEEVLITDKDYKENYREYSPDSSMLLINYSIDIGAFGYAQMGTAVLKLADTTKNLRQFSLPNTLERIKWLDNKNISAQFDILPNLRSGETIILKDIIVNNVKIRITELNYIFRKDDKPEIEHKEVSPNGQFELVAYRYPTIESGYNIIHISIIPVSGQIPKYGNFLISDKESDYILYGTWTKSNELIFYSNSQYSNLIQYFLVKNRPKIKYKFIVDDKKYRDKYLWTE